MRNNRFESRNVMMLAAILCASSPVFGQKSISASAVGQIRSLIAEKAARSPAQMKLDSQLYYSAKTKRGQAIASGVTALAIGSALETNGQGLVHVDIKATVTSELLGVIANLGGRVESAFPQYNAVR